MAARLIRIKDDLDERAKAYAEGLGVSVNALFVIALSEYLEAKTAFQGRVMEKPGTRRPIEQPGAIPAQEFRLTPSPPARTAEGTPIVLSREQRRRLDRMAKKPGKR